MSPALFGVDLTRALTRDAKRRFGTVGYAIAALRVVPRLRPFRAEIMHGNTIHMSRTIHVAVGNGRHNGRHDGIGTPARVVASRTPSIATFGTGRAGDAQVHATRCPGVSGVRWVSASDPSPYSRTTSPACACWHRICRRSQRGRSLPRPDGLSTCAADGASGTLFLPEQDTQAGAEICVPVWRSISAHNRGSVQFVRFSTGSRRTALATARAFSPFSGDGPGASVVRNTSIPPSPNHCRQWHTEAAVTPKASAICPLVHPDSVRSIARSVRFATHVRACQFGEHRFLFICHTQRGPARHGHHPKPIQRR